MIVLVARYYGKTGTGDQILEALQEMAPQVKSLEPGCVMYQVSRSNENPNNFLLYEQYVDQAALDAHRAMPHFNEIVEETIVPLLERREREFFSLAIA
jgi:quinol monooxygenase YgiN